MDSAAASAYVYAKASGMLAKSFIGDTASKLFSVKSLKELYGLLFSNEAPSVPESILAKEIEAQAERQFISDYITLLKSYSNPKKVLITLLRFYDYDNLKEVGAALSIGEQKLPEIADIKEYSLMNFKAWPNIAKITAKSPVSWYNSVNDISEQYKIDERIDAQYISEIWDAIQELSGTDREEIEKILSTEISFRNITWAIRLKLYYKLSKEEILEQLAFADKSLGKRDSFARQAIKILDKDIENWDDWKDWKYSAMLNPHEDGVIWQIDPTWVGKSLRQELNKMYMKAFHKNPMSVMSLVSWFKIKQFELDCIRTVAEGLRLDVESNELMNATGVSIS